MRKEKLMHFSHHHPLREFNVKEDDAVVCSCCELELSGSAFKCNSKCDFFMDKSCLKLTQQILHKSHPAHALTLLPDRSFKCDACGETSSGFAYRCSICDYDLHVKCSSLPETVKREEHKHLISLYYSMINKNDNVVFVCDLCDNKVKYGCWVYYCGACDFGTHLECKEAEEDEEEEEKEEDQEQVDEKAVSSGPSKVMSALEVQHEMQMIQLRVQASRQQAQMIADMGRNAITLTGGSTYRYL